MATYNYYLRDKKSLSKTPIILYISNNNKVTKIATGETIEPKYWDNKKKLAKGSYTGSDELNAFLMNYQQKAEAKFREFKSEDVIPSKGKMRKATEVPEEKPTVDLIGSLELFTATNKGVLQPSTIRKYTSLKNHLITFKEKTRKHLTFEAVDIDFSEAFGAFLVNDQKQNNNTVCKYIKALKSFMQWAADRDLHTNFAFRKFKAKEYTVDVLYLTEKEVQKLVKLKLKDHPALARVRDAFCFGCFTGQRFSDIHNIQWEDLKNNTWHLHTKKTKDKIEIPLNEHALAIIKKYKGQPTPIAAYSNQKMNDHLKTLAKKADFNDLHKLVSYKGNVKEESTEVKHTLISTHTARRTFVTLSLEKGMRPETVMEITGHKDYKTLKRYIKITSKVKENEMKSVWNKK